MWGLEYFSFRDLWSPLFMIFMMAIIVLYTFVIGPWRHRFAGSAPVSVSRQLAFLLAIVLLYLTQGGPLSLMGHLMFTFHMTNMALAYILVPPLLIYGIPDWLWRRIFQARFWRWRVFYILMNPVISMGLFTLLFSFYHMPDNHDWIMTHYTVHRIYYALLFLSATMMWWHVYCPIPEWRRMSHMLTLLYIFMSGLLLTPACAMIIFASGPLFGVYNDPQVWVKAMGYCMTGDPAEVLSQVGGPAFFNMMSGKDDQQLGGIVMKLLQEFVNAAALYTVFMQWYRKEREQDDEQPAAPASKPLVD
ncbi:cytochrome c oxidase assembly factor CtaG [Cohnella cholangitidis]|uniref:Cytochrome c oxidase assembly factor CtaG n=1 Tax=Cohnella cholangitidis TaxID=2598458 RepID=A0A7G5C1B6_9BACL|nr:cytochrome c oxidase assembly factor CtaG [Cohnella cholangitidis]QMV43000.1 cytochrome c oxidase assembly factor CtaG [Cohnella cholangitidis]